MGTLAGHHPQQVLLARRNACCVHPEVLVQAPEFPLAVLSDCSLLDCLFLDCSTTVGERGLWDWTTGGVNSTEDHVEERMSIAARRI
jgi:hypothetical protein